MSKTKRGEAMPASIEHLNGSTLIPGSDGYPDNANGEIVIMLESGEIITDYVLVDHRGDPSDTAQEINKLLEDHMSGQLVYVDCGDDQFYFYLKKVPIQGRTFTDDVVKFYLKHPNNATQYNIQDLCREILIRRGLKWT